MATNTNKKSILESIIVVMLVSIFVVISALIVSTVLSNSVFTDIAVTGTNTNETLSSVGNETPVSFAILSTYPTATCTLVSVNNATSGLVVPVSNYTYSACTMLVSNESAYYEEDLNVTYDYSRPSGTSLAGVNTTQLSNNFGLFVTGLISFLSVLGTIIGVLWLIFYVRQLFDKKNGVQGISA